MTEEEEGDWPTVDKVLPKNKNKIKYLIYFH